MMGAMKQSMRTPQMENEGSLHHKNKAYILNRNQPNTCYFTYPRSTATGQKANCHQPATASRTFKVIGESLVPNSRH